MVDTLVGTNIKNKCHFEILCVMATADTFKWETPSLNFPSVGFSEIPKIKHILITKCYYITSILQKVIAWHKCHIQLQNILYTHWFQNYHSSDNEAVELVHFDLLLANIEIGQIA